METEVDRIQKMLKNIRNKKKEIKTEQDQIAPKNHNQKDIYDDDNWGLEDR